jgi:hypothetical protein
LLSVMPRPQLAEAVDFEYNGSLPWTGLTTDQLRRLSQSLNY